MYDRVKHHISKKREEQIQHISIPKMTLTVEQMADELNISKPTAYNLVKSEGFPAFAIGHRLLINRQGLQQWLDLKSGMQYSNKQPENE